MKAAITKFLIALACLVGLAGACFAPIDRGLIAILLGVMVLVVLPSTILLAIDAGRAIREERPSRKGLRVLGTILAIPQGALGVILMATGLVYPFFGMASIFQEFSKGVFPFIPLLRTVGALAMLGTGYFYLRALCSSKR